MKTTWKGDPELKCSVVTNLVQHREADNFLRGRYVLSGGTGFRGCALGCTLVPFGASRDQVKEIDRWVAPTQEAMAL